MSFSACLVVMAGGAIGTLARYLVSLNTFPILVKFGPPVHQVSGKSRLFRWGIERNLRFTATKPISQHIAEALKLRHLTA